MRSLTKTTRRIAIFTHDTLAAIAAFPISVLLRLGGDVALFDIQQLYAGWALFVVIAMAVIGGSRLDRGSWRYASIDEAVLIARASVIANLILLLALFLLFRADAIPRSVVPINIFVFAALLALPRLGYRAWRDGRVGALLERGTHWRVPVIVVGAGDEAEAFQREMRRDSEAPYRVLAIVDDDPTAIGSTIRGVPVRGPVTNMPQIVEKLSRHGARPERLVVTPRYGSPAHMKQLLQFASELGMRLDRLPPPNLLRKASDGRMEVQPVDVEDLLSRPQARLDRDAMRALIKGKRIVVTGAGGSIGSELVRQISDYHPAMIALLEQSEFNLYEIDRTLGETHPEIVRMPLICDVRDAGRIERCFELARPDVVFHAAALKHVPMLEPQPAEAVLTNVMGSRQVADACVRHGVSTMVLISTDKASNPVSIMGATKRAAEAYAQALDLDRNADGGHGTRFVTVRFGNVLGSAGSVVPLFQKQLARGGPLTVTHPDMVRYFMTIREAVELVLYASAAETQESANVGAIVVLDMGEPVRIIDMARQMIRLAGFEPDKDIRIEITGIRPGERMSEALFDEREELLPSGHQGLLLARPAVAPLADTRAAIDAMIDAARAGRDEDVKACLAPFMDLPEAMPAPAPAAGRAVAE